MSKNTQKTQKVDASEKTESAEIVGKVESAFSLIMDDGQQMNEKTIVKQIVENPIICAHITNPKNHPMSEIREIPVSEQLHIIANDGSVMYRGQSRIAGSAKMLEMGNQQTVHVYTEFQTTAQMLAQKKARKIWKDQRQ